MGALVLAAERADAAAYVFTNVADDSSVFEFGFGQQPSINSGGAVAFYGVRSSPFDRGIFKVTGGALTVIATDASTGKFNMFSDKIPSINANGVVAFGAELINGNAGIFKGSGDATTTIAENGGAFRSFGAPTINAGGNVAFFASFDVPDESISAGAGGAVTTIDRASTTPRQAYGTAPSIYTLNTVAFRGDLDAGGSGLFTGDGTTVATIAQTSPTGFTLFGNPSLNDARTVAFRAETSAGPRGIYKVSGGATTTVAISDPTLFSDFAESVSINTPGSIAFVANLRAGGKSLFVDTNGVRQEVIGTGDALFNSTVSDFNFGNTALNDTGQLAFFYQLADGRTGIALAVPEAGTCSLLAIAAGFLSGRRRRRVKLPD